MKPATPAVKFRIIIPARFASTRFPGKVLAELAGKPMIQHVYEQACKTNAQSVLITTDHPDVMACAKNFGAAVLLTRQHETGTDRIAEAITLAGYASGEIIVNVQADEPLIDPLNIQQAAALLAHDEVASVATLCAPMTELDLYFDPNLVKVVFDDNHHALYFSRAPIPWDRAGFATQPPQQLSATVGYSHIGLYAMRAGFIHEYVRWPQHRLELCESLEQLRILARGYKIHVGIAAAKSYRGVDTPADLVEIARIIESLN